VNAEIATADARRKTDYDAAATWAGDVNGRLKATAKIAWMVAAGACAVAVLEAVALASLLPLKTVQPYTILVDRNTGYVETATGLKPGPLTQDAAVTQSNLVSYVTARETFDATDLTENFRKVQLLSAGAAREQYLREMSPDNPASPVKQNTADTTVQTVIKSVSLLNPTSALVRFDTVRRTGGQTGGEMRPYSAVISFRYTGAPMKMADRFVNPLGFQVIRYRRDAETTGAIPIPSSLQDSRP
jgi:type IV secretion system protein VirB8